LVRGNTFLLSLVESFLIRVFLTLAFDRYNNGKVDGKVWGPWPGSALHFIQLLRQPRWEDYDIEYLTPNRFEYLGNGKSEAESTGDDLAWYVNEPGISDANSVHNECS
jgi:hypothetical protein